MTVDLISREEWIKNNLKKGLLALAGIVFIGITSKIAEAKNLLYKDSTGTLHDITPNLNQTVVLDGDLRGLYASSATKKIPYKERGAGITITSITVQCSSADPTTELNANIMRCDAQGTGAFPGANPTLVKAIDTTTGNFSWTGTEAVATGKELYLLLDADPVDLSTMWTITILYTIN